MVIVALNITDYHNKYNNKEKIWDIERIIKIWHRKAKGVNVIGNGADRLAGHRVATNIQFFEKHNICKAKNLQ